MEPFRSPLYQIPESERPQIEERAALFEHEAGLDRDTAERKAALDWLEAQR
jgi:hypothetical protein